MRSKISIILLALAGALAQNGSPGAPGYEGAGAPGAPGGYSVGASGFSESSGVLFVPSDGFREVALRLLNQYRTKSGALPLALDQDLNLRAHAHAEKLADTNALYSSNLGFRQNIWSHRGELITLAKNCEYAIDNWYTESLVPGNVKSILDSSTLKSDSVTRVGFGVGTSEKFGEGYTVVVAFYK